jgi:diguanylate cyclase (GGDEF)-like protein
MQLTSHSPIRGVPPAPAPSWHGVTLTGAALLAIGAIDYRTGAAPFQHLYYLPIIWAAIRFGRLGGVLAALCAVVLYHLANPSLLSRPLRTGDMLEAILFLVVGLVTTTLAEEASRMRLLAHTDDLTGLHNLRSFEARLNGIVSKAKARSFPLSLMVLDLDRLKRINDAHGHLAGGEAVRLVGQVIAQHLPADAVACRYGGDEFVVALPRRTVDQAVGVAESLRLAVHGLTPTLAGHPFPAGALSISIGVACRAITPSDTSTHPGEELFREADRALYVAKAEGRNRVHGTWLPAPAPTGSLSVSQPTDPRRRT